MTASNALFHFLALQLSETATGYTNGLMGLSSGEDSKRSDEHVHCFELEYNLMRPFEAGMEHDVF